MCKGLAYQGVLEYDGKVVTQPQDLEFRMYNSTAVGAVPVYTESEDGVPVHQGCFSVVLGDDEDQPGAFEAIIASADDLYLLIAVLTGGDPVVLQGRQPSLTADAATISYPDPAGAVQLQFKGLQQSGVYEAVAQSVTGGTNDTEKNVDVDAGWEDANTTTCFLVENHHEFTTRDNYSSAISDDCWVCHTGTTWRLRAKVGGDCVTSTHDCSQDFWKSVIRCKMRCLRWNW